MNKIVEHPLIKDKLTALRNKKTNSYTFRSLLTEIVLLMMYEVSKDLTLSKIEIDTPVDKMVGYKLKNTIVVVPILRAGLGMVEGVVKIIPNVKIGHIGLYRNEKTLKPVEYYEKMPEISKNTDVILLDPMLATGNSAIRSIDLIKKKYKPRSIKFVGIIAAPEGLNSINKAHEDVDVYIAALDKKLNSKGYILPGLGDAGDRLFETK